MDARKVTDDFTTCPQIEPDDVAAIRQAGFTLLINNRPDHEIDAEMSDAVMQAAANAAGIAYRAVPVSGGPTSSQIEEMAGLIKASPGPVFAYCRSGTRSITLWALARLAQGADRETIVQAGAQAGYDLSGLP